MSAKTKILITNSAAPVFFNKRMDVSVIVVNYNTKTLTSKCIESVYKFTPPNRHSARSEGSKTRNGMDFEVIVVDNASKDGSPEYLKKKFPQVKFILNKTNIGFGRANNQGVNIAKGKFIFFLNSDASLIENSLKKLLQKAIKTENLGILAPRILNVDKTIQQSVGFFPHLPQVFYWMSFLDDFPFGQKFKPYHVDHDSFYKNENVIDWATGAALLVAKSALIKAGAFDENIFMYGEDVELCYRVKKAKLKIIYTPLTEIVHIGSGSSGKISKNAFIGEFKGVIYFYKKYRGSISLQILRLFLKMGALARILIFSLLGRRELAKFYAEAYKVV